MSKTYVVAAGRSITVKGKVVGAGRVVTEELLGESPEIFVKSGFVEVVDLSEQPVAPPAPEAAEPEAKVESGGVKWDFTAAQLDEATAEAKDDADKLSILNALIEDKNTKFIEDKDRMPLAESVEEAYDILTIDRQE